jgi:uncharacterized protein YbcV (DUF1398 family)
MFTLEQIKNAHSNVKSGADFPAYIKEIKALGVTNYETFVADGHINYFGANNYLVEVPAKYEPIAIAKTTDIPKFSSELKAHQQGKTDFLTFIKMCADTGIEKWEINMKEMTCTYFNLDGEEVLVESIPQ